MKQYSSNIYNYSSTDLLGINRVLRYLLHENFLKNFSLIFYALLVLLNLLYLFFVGIFENFLIQLEVHPKFQNSYRKLLFKKNAIKLNYLKNLKINYLLQRKI